MNARKSSSQSGMKDYGWDKAEVPMIPQWGLPKEWFEHMRREDKTWTRGDLIKKLQGNPSEARPQSGAIEDTNTGQV